MIVGVTRKTKRKREEKGAKATRRRELTVDLVFLAGRKRDLRR
jgi:hypothetical protein